MNISRPFITRPIATTLLVVGVLLLGLLGYRALPVTALPAVDFPTIQVSARLPGAAPQIVVSAITTPLEQQLGKIPGLEEMNSVSAFGASRITLRFGLERDIDAAAQDVQAQINAASGLLPLQQMPGPPVYRKVNPADTPVLIMAVSSRQFPLRTVADYADTLVVQKLSQIAGVGLVSAAGAQRAAIRLQLNPTLLAGLDLSLAEVRAAVEAANSNLPKGSLDGEAQAYQIGADDQLLDAQAYRRQVVAYRNGAAIRLGDLGRVVEGVEDDSLAATANGEPAVILDVRRQPGANVIEVVDRIHALLPDLQAALPPGIELQVLADRTLTIRAAIAEVQFTLGLTVVLVVLVMFAFLRKPWATLIPSVVLPVSLIATFGVMALAGFSLNNLSLMALTVATGFVVDDAIVMIENIVRHLEEGEPPLQAALKGARQIGFTVVSLTVSLIAVFIPLLLMGGVIGRLFHEFAVTLSTAVLISMLLSLTLTPMMCAHLLPAAGGRMSAAAKVSDATAFERLRGRYAQGLDWVLRHQLGTLLVTLFTLVLTTWLYWMVPKGFLPQQDTGLIVGIVDAAPDVSSSKMSQLMDRVAERLLEDPEVVSVSAYSGVGDINTTPNTGRLYLVLRPHARRAASVDAILQRLKQRAADIAGVELYLRVAQELQIENREARTQYQYVLQSSDPGELDTWVPRLQSELRASGELADVASDYKARGLQLVVDVDRDTAARLGVSMRAVDETLYDAFAQRQIATLYAQTNQYKVVLEVGPEFRRDPDALGGLYVKSGTGDLVPLSELADFSVRQAPLALSHFGLFPSSTLSFNLPSGGSLGAAVQALQSAGERIGLPQRMVTGFVGSAAEFGRSAASQVWLILAAVVVVYIVLGVLYESYIHPVTILSTLPSAGVGALLALWLTGGELDVISLIGIILLIGIVKKNAIMMIDFALEQQRLSGGSAEEAIRRAALLRFRPIMMTTAAALFGALPLALGSGPGSELRTPLGVAIVGGLLLSQFLSLYTTPVVYLWFDRLQRHLKLRPGDAAAPARETAE